MSTWKSTFSNRKYIYRIGGFVHCHVDGPACLFPYPPQRSTRDSREIHLWDELCEEIHDVELFPSAHPLVLDFFWGVIVVLSFIGGVIVCSFSFSGVLLIYCYVVLGYYISILDCCI